ncbi:MAG TPA: CAP domain-containing protein [Trebonia sp.]
MDGDDQDHGKWAARPGRRAWLLLSGVAVLAVLAGGSLYLARGVFSAGTGSGQATVDSRTMAADCGAAGTASCSASPAGVTVVVPPAVVTVPPRQAAARAHPAGTGTSPAASHSGSPSPRQTAAATGAASSQASAPASSPASGGTSGAQGSAAAGQVLALINQARAAAGLPALSVTAGLDASSSAHNQLMAGGCGLSHQCPGEPALGDRETAAGVGWTAAGENIGEGGPVAGTTAAIAQMAVGLTQSMLNEKPPDDGHRLNILSSTFTHIGIAVYRDGSGTVWLTQDFSN